MHRGTDKKNDEVVVREVGNAADNLRGVQKHDDAVWVSGLKPHHHGGSSYSGEDSARGIDEANPGPNWLRGTILVGLQTLIFLTLRIADFAPRASLEFPANEVDAWPLVRQHGVKEKCHAIAPIVYSIFAAKLCMQLGVATGHFALFMGVGLACLAILAAVGEMLMLYIACPEGADECFLPLVMHWICVTVSIVGPCVAVALTAVVWDGFLSKRRFPLWTVALASPIVCWGVHWVSIVYNGTPDHTAWLLYATYAQLAAWIALLVRCYGQPPFRVLYYKAKAE